LDKEPIDIVEIRNWLKAPDPSTNFITACDKKTLGTGEWILSQPQYIQWCEGTAGLLWIQGKGKSLFAKYEVKTKWELPSGIRQNNSLVSWVIIQIYS
jgi:hypothetical protein